VKHAAAWLWPLLLGGCASAAAMMLQDLVRGLWQVRSLPERVMEWLLLFVPLDTFERALAQFGADAKELALFGTSLGMGVALALLGAVVVRTGWRSWHLFGVGLGLWLLTMLLVMPITGAGAFGTSLLVSPLLTTAGFLLVFCGYATVLLVGTHPDAPPPSVMRERRALLVGLFGIAASGGLAALVGRQGAAVASTLPLAAAPTPSAPPVRTLAMAPLVQPTPTVEPLPSPPPSRRLARDQDGALTAAGRPRGQLAPPITATDDFYVVTKNAVADPLVDAATWRLVVDGEVNTPIQLDYRTLRALPAVDVVKTLECISNFTSSCNLTSFGCDLLSTAQFRGARLSDLLELAGGLKTTTAGLAILSLDEFSAGLPAALVHDPEALVVYEMNGQPLPREHGFPARLLVPGRYGMKNPKWLAGIRAVAEDYAGWYEQRNWDKDGVVKTMSRIDTPVDGGLLRAGAQRVAGIAYAGDRGVARVEVSFDDGVSWREAQLLEPMPGKDVMVRWELAFAMPSRGSLNIVVRATDGTGAVQPEEFQLPQPDGASGRDSISVSAA
jgi:DMSO/TMAO reductase YedYZ molybdopterin-dependent catalytic subunit